MGKSFTFTTKSYPVNDLLALDFQEHLDSMARLGWNLVSTQQLMNGHSSPVAQMILFWGKDEER
jgi:hypothetical protein